MEEPLFILRAQDIHAPEIIIKWAQTVIQNPAATRASFDKATAALSKALEMMAWQQANPDKVKIPDLNYLIQSEAA